MHYKSEATICTNIEPRQCYQQMLHAKFAAGHFILRKLTTYDVYGCVSGKAFLLSV